ncbi:hypothetical protein BRC60_11380 [Halobacteriales archaeon QH_1_68_42]|nr:MAG: hypothetical protein BRC60_11380 [Halobacteriales archaeon QH_1_68_42]
MSKVSVTGSKAVMGDVVEAVHDLHLVHLSDYDGRWEGFENGNPMAGGDEASEKLLTVRSLESILGVTDEDAGPTRIVTDEALDEELEEIRVEANDLDDRRSELRDELREIEEREEAIEPFAELGIDLDLLWGYDSLAVAVGEGGADSMRAALSDIEGATEVFSEGSVVAAFAHADEGPRGTGRGQPGDGRTGDRGPALRRRGLPPGGRGEALHRGPEGRGAPLVCDDRERVRRRGVDPDRARRGVRGGHRRRRR